MQVRLHPGIRRCWNFGAMTIEKVVLRLPRGAHATFSTFRRETSTLWVVSGLKPHPEVARLYRLARSYGGAEAIDRGGGAELTGLSSTSRHLRVEEPECGRLASRHGESVRASTILGKGGSWPRG
jgi:hypothetical protein